jgi:redox-sensitive bicupin YhaK (pirin superfamily)
MGAAARYGDGDIQWLTAGAGIQHAEMFPLLDAKSPNPLNLFQIWLNLPRERKLVEPAFAMLWSPTIPQRTFRDDMGADTVLTVHAGSLAGVSAPTPPAASWAADPANQVVIASLRFDPGARWTLPASVEGIHRTLFFFSGSRLSLNEESLPQRHQAELRGDTEIEIENGATESEALLLQGRPIGEPVAWHGPFVMNTSAEIHQAMRDFQRTRFGGWPWPDTGPVHGSDPARFARAVDGTVHRPSV